MARSYGKILASLASDAEFNSLPVDAGYLYLRLLGQPTLTLVGSLRYWPAKWSAYAAEWTRETVEEAVAVLEERAYLLVDRDTEEVLIRTLTRHDGIPTGNPKLRKGLWATWHDLGSIDLRRAAVLNMPPELFLYPDAPDAAVQMRWSGQSDSVTDSPIGSPIGSVSDSPVSNLYPPAAVPGSVPGFSSDEAKAVAAVGLEQARTAFDRSKEQA